ncbi:MAG: glycosyltransferase [Ginsengibacter sp.]|jgi:hypothetical protein
MISVLICSVKPHLLKKVSENIRKTIGIPHEILFKDNRIENSGVCKVYNELALKAKYEKLCFIHEDVILKTADWGKKIIELFEEDKSIGLIGLAGCKYKSGYFSGWYSGVREFDCANYFHEYPDGNEHVYLNPKQSGNPQEVVCIDGVFICCTKEAWQQTLFDEKLLKGFHFYDIDFSLRVSKEFKSIVAFDIDLVHITTGGDYSNNWVETAILYHQEKKDFLPFSKISIDSKATDRKVIKTTMDHLKYFKISWRNKFRWIILQKLFLNPSYFYSIAKFLFYEPLGLKKIHTKLKNR